MNTKMMIRENTLGKWIVKPLLLSLLLIVGVGEAVGQAGQTVVFQNASIGGDPGYSMTWVNNEGDGTRVVTTDKTFTNTAQQWVIEDAGDGFFYLKNVNSETYLARSMGDNWTMRCYTAAELLTLSDNRAKFQFTNRLPDGRFTIKTTNNLLSPNANYTSNNGAVFADKALTGANPYWQGVPTPLISYSDGTYTITCPDAEADIYYTTDGSDPNTSGTKYTTAISGSGVAVVKAVAKRDYYLSSLTAERFSPEISFLIQHQRNTYFYALPGAADGDNLYLQTTSLARPSTKWHLIDAGVEDGEQYYYIRNDSTGWYLNCVNPSNGTVRLKNSTLFDPSSDEYKFRFAYNSTLGAYRIVFKVNQTRWLNKGSNFDPSNNAGNNNNASSADCHWNFIPILEATPRESLPSTTLPFTPSDNENVYYYKIRNVGANTFYIIPPTGDNGNSRFANTAEGDSEEMLWYFKQASTDDYLTYYYIINAKTGEYLYYNEAIDASTHTVAFRTVSPSRITMEENERCQFAIPRTGNDAENYYVVPKVLRYNNNRVSYNTIWRDNTNPLKLNVTRNSTVSIWTFVSSATALMPPYFEQSATDNTLVIATTTPGATIHYTTDGSDPTDSSPVYSSAVVLTESITTVKAIAIKGGNTSSVSIWAVRPLTGTTHQYFLSHKANDAFFMIPGNVNAGGNWTLNTYSLMRPSMAWNFIDAGIEKGIQYYYLRNDSTGYYVSCNSGGVVYLKSPSDFGDGSSDDYKFRLHYNTDDGSYWIMSKARTDYWLNKGDDNNRDNTVNTNNNTSSTDCRWNIMLKGQISTETLPFTLSTDGSVSYYRIKNVNASTYYIIPPTESSPYANTSAAGGTNDRWFIRQVASDAWLNYYSIINAKTGECLVFNGAISNATLSNAFGTVALSVAEMADNDRVQFAVARTTASSSDGYYYIIPKLIRYLNNGRNFNLIWRDNDNPLKTQQERGDGQRKWVFESSTFTCETPEYTYDAVQGTLVLSSPNNVPMYYVGWNDGDSEPSLTDPTEGTLYTGPFDVSYKKYKVIAARSVDGSDKSADLTINLDVAFRCAQPVIRYTTSTKTVTMTSATASATIYYTTDGSTPTTSSTLYTGPFVYASSYAIKAIAIRGVEVATTSDVTTFNAVPKYISRSSDIDNMAGNYAADPDGFTVDTAAPIGTDGAPFTGTFDGAYVPIELSHALFGYVDGGTIKNVQVATLSGDLSGTNVGAVVNEARGTARIYNCGVTDSTHTINATNAAGGIVGHIASGSSVKVVNCYNYATVSGSTYSGGIVGWNESNVASGTRIAMCMMYGNMTTGTNRSPVYYGGHTSNNQDYTEYNYYRSRANLSYTAYNDQLAIDKNEWLTRFPFYRHILNTHRELAAFFLFHDSQKSAVGTETAPTSDEIAEIGHWVVKKGENAPFYPIIEPWLSNTKKTTVDIEANLPSTTNRYEGKKLDDITADKVYRGDGTQVTTMGSSGMLRVNYNINGTTGYVNLPITDMDTLRYDYTWGKVVLPFVNEISGWYRDYSKICTGWKITSVTGGTAGSLTNYNFADRDCTAKDLYASSNYIFAQGGNYIVPYGVTAITIEANFANAYYLSDAYSDFGYDTNYGSQTNLGWEMPTTYHGQTVYTNLGTLIGAMPTSADPNSQAIVLVGNYHYNQNTIGGLVFNANKAVTIMSVDEDCNQEPDYTWFTNQSSQNRSDIPPTRFDFVANIGIGMAARVTNSTRYPSLGIFHGHGWFEYTETSLAYMSECEINSASFNVTDNGNGNNRWIANNGYFEQIIRGFDGADNKLSYVQIGGKAYVKQYYPSSHITKDLATTLRPTVVTGGEIEECFMTGNHSTAVGDNIYFWSAGGKIHKYLSAYTTNITTATTDVTAKVDHALIRRFFGGGTSTSAPITGNINITMNNSRVDFFCGGPEFGDMTPGKTVSTTAIGSVFGEYYGAGFGGTSLTTIYTKENQSVDFGSTTVEYPYNLSDSYDYLDNDKTSNKTVGIGIGYAFDFILYSGGTGSGVARFYNKYARFSLAKSGSVINNVRNCTFLHDFYGAGCQGTVDGTVTSTLTGCTVAGSVFGGGFKAESNEVKVYPRTQPTKSVYTKETGLFSDFGTVEPETWTWEQGTAETPVADAGNKIIKCSYTVTMTALGNVTGAITLTVDGGTVGEDVFGGGNESKSLDNVTVTIQNGATVGNSVYGGGNEADVLKNTNVTMTGGYVFNRVFGGGNMGSVGTITTTDGTGKPTAFAENTGLCTVAVSGGQVGPLGMSMTGEGVDGIATPDDYGYVFGACRGETGDPATDPSVNNKSYVDNANVTISGTAFITGGVYGGSEAGRVLHNTSVTISGGQIGEGKGAGRPYTEDEWAAGTPLAPCATWTYIPVSADYDSHVYDPYADDEGQYPEGTLPSRDTHDGYSEATDGHTFYGNVFAGGSGFSPYAPGKWLRSSGIVEGNATLTITGGHILSNVYGGCEVADVYGSVTMSMTGGTVGVPRTTDAIKDLPTVGHFFGGGKGDKRVLFNTWTNVDASTVSITGGRVYGNIFGGGEDGHVLHNAVSTINSASLIVGCDGDSGDDGCVYGGGKGAITALTAGVVGGNITLNIQQAQIRGDVYGGGQLASVGSHFANPTIIDPESGEEIPNPEYGVVTNDDSHGNITVNLTGGTIDGNVYGGSMGTVINPELGESRSTFIHLNEGVADDARGCVVKGDIFGCNNVSSSPRGSVHVHVYKTQNADATRITNTDEYTTAKVEGRYDVNAVYGGGNLAEYNPTFLLALDDKTAARPEVIIDGCERTSIKTVYGGGNAACTPSTKVVINGTYEIEEVFGGGNGKDDLPDGRPNPGANVGYRNYSTYNEVTGMWEDNDDADTKEKRLVSSYVYGTGEASVNIYGGTIHRVFGGSNTKGNVRIVAVTLLDNEDHECEFCVDEAYGGGKSAPMDGAANLIMACIPGLKHAYGGAQNAHIEGNVNLTITNGTFDRVFGGNDTDGYIKGTIVVNIEETGCKPIIIGELYGGGNQAPYTAPAGEHGPTLNVRSFTSIGDIYGGGYGAGAVVTGDTYVNVNVSPGLYADLSDNPTLQHYVDSVLAAMSLPAHADGKIGAIKNVYGGGNAAQVTGNTFVNIGTESTQIYNTPTTKTVTIDEEDVEQETTDLERTHVVTGADIRENIYGGGNAAVVTGNTKVVVGKEKVVPSP